ncbi:MAG: hypothetical protein FJX74_24780, partial [Armatimonadetes bacterium]|nr:hypothetical protein [Armatimonadota bacterium]
MTVLMAGPLALALDGAGEVASLRDEAGGVEYCPPDQPGPLLRLTVEGNSLAPSGAEWAAEAGALRLRYGDAGPTAVVKVARKPTHLTFELIAVEGAQPTVADWGPIATTIGETVGATVGVVRNARFALGIQGLNI